MLMGWAFAFLVEGASGFGTPAALAAPIPSGLRILYYQAATVTLVSNTVRLALVLRTLFGTGSESEALRARAWWAGFVYWSDSACLFIGCSRTCVATCYT